MRFSIIKREPSYFFENIHEDLNRFLKDTFGDFENLEKNAPALYKAFRPAVEIKENKNSYKMKVELPNVNKEDIDVELNKNSISIKAESKFEQCQEEENLKTTEFRYGKFVRVIPLEQEINPDEAKSEFKNGILHIELPKIHEDKKEDIKKLKID
ncbi:MAG: Hsp20/alpha crystallin family protein [Candidatus Gastranaerophilales bacterium]|nr:Hsp20/alpha crystallin family protein [Candidatus Gastranaerophilales bacterium]